MHNFISLSARKGLTLMWLFSSSFFRSLKLGSSIRFPLFKEDTKTWPNEPLIELPFPPCSMWTNRWSEEYAWIEARSILTKSSRSSQRVRLLKRGSRTLFSSHLPIRFLILCIEKDNCQDLVEKMFMIYFKNERICLENEVKVKIYPKYISNTWFPRVVLSSKRWWKFKLLHSCECNCMKFILFKGKMAIKSCCISIIRGIFFMCTCMFSTSSH